MRNLTPLQRAVVTMTAVLAVGAFAFGAGLAQPNVLTIQHEPATRAPERHTATTTPHLVSVDGHKQHGPHRAVQPHGED